MIYLRSFNMPKDTWVDYYFVPILQRSDSFKPEDFPNEGEYIEPDQRTIHDSWYPWKTFYGRGLEQIEFNDITIFYGGNASGKTTLLNVIAQKLNLQRVSLFNRSYFFDDYCKLNGGYELCDKYKSPLAINRGKIIVSDDVFNRILGIRQRNSAKDIAIEDKSQEFFQKHLPQSMTVSKFIKKTMNHHMEEELSNGESGFQYFIEQIPDEALILLDEPENSLSAEWQTVLARELYSYATERKCQLIIASHSPFILSILGTKIYNLDSNPISIAQWHELDNMRAYYNLFKSHTTAFESAKYHEKH